MAPEAPRSALANMSFDRDENNFLLDFENWCLEHRWEGDFPKGPRRYEHPEWAAMIRRELEDYPLRSFEHYAEWCRAGGGDEWFSATE